MNSSGVKTKERLKVHAVISCSGYNFIVQCSHIILSNKEWRGVCNVLYFLVSIQYGRNTDKQLFTFAMHEETIPRVIHILTIS